jgi:hypothetical protein
MRRTLPLALAALTALAMLVPMPSIPGGVGISTAPDSVATEAYGWSIDTVAFYPWRPNGDPFSERDLEFQWDYLFAKTRGYDVRFGPEDRNNLRRLGSTIADPTLARNPFNAPYSDLHLVHDYLGWLNHASLSPYDASPLAPHGYYIGDSSLAEDDRSHTDFYIYTKGHLNTVDRGQYPSEFGYVLEDSTTGHAALSTPLHTNSIMYVGPYPSAPRIEEPNWTYPDYPLNGNFNHEFAHAVHGGVFALPEIFSSGAEALAGHDPVEMIRYEAPYTWSLLAFGSGGGCDNLESVARNYQAFRLFSAYLLYNYRGDDHDPVLPATPGGDRGFGDDVFYKWAHTDSLQVNYIGRLLLDDVCDDCSAARRPYFHPGGVPLDRNRRLELLLHHWRVANYVNNPALDDGQYGYPSEFGFSPRIDVGCWQTIIDTSWCTPGVPCDTACNDGIVIPPEVTLTTEQAVRETTFVGRRTWADGEFSYPMVLQPLGAEYWVIRSSPELAALDGDLVVRVTPENIHRGGHELIQGFGPDTTWTPFDSHLLASVVGYSQHEVGGQPDSLWRHPDWATTVVGPSGLETDRRMGEVELTLPHFGTDHKAALITVTLADDSVGHYASAISLGYVPAIRYRLTLGVRTSGALAPNPLPIAVDPLYLDDWPAWSPSGDALAYTDTSTARIHIRSLDGQSDVALDPNVASLGQAQPDWSPRGDWIAFRDRRELRPHHDVYAYNRVTSEERLVTGASPAGSHQAPAFSPNGHQVAYLVRLEGASGDPDSLWQVRRVDLDGANDALLATTWDGHEVRPLRWSPTGDSLFFFSHDTAYAVPAAGGTPTVYATFGDALGSFDLALDGRRVLVEQAGRDTFFITHELKQYQPPLILDWTDSLYLPYRRLAVKDRVTRDLQQRFFRNGVEFHNPRLSWDGTRVAYTTSRTDGGWDLAVGQVSWNHPPAFTTPPRDTAILYKHPLAFDVAASDPDGETMSFQTVYLPTGATFVNGHFAWDSAGTLGDHYVVIRAHDLSGGVDNRVVRIQVLPDTLPPAPVSDLILEPGRYNAVLTWTAPGDDSTQGTAVEFDLRIAPFSINEGNFYSATRVATEAPGPAGTVHCAEAAPLSGCTWYWAAVKTRDRALNWSALSNVPTGRTKCSGYTLAECGEGMYAQGGGEGQGVSPENALVDDGSNIDVLALHATAPSEGGVAVRLVEKGADTGLDEVGLIAVPRPATGRTYRVGKRFVSADTAAVASLGRPGMDEAEFEDARAATGEIACEAGDTLLVGLGGGAGPHALVLEAADTPRGAPPDSCGILVQAFGEGGCWKTAAHVHLRRGFDRVLVDSLGSDSLRLLILSDHVVRGVARGVDVTTVSATKLYLESAMHSRLGQATLALRSSGGKGSVLADGDVLDLGFEGPPNDGEYDLFLVAARPGGSFEFAVGEARPREVELPTRFALHQNLPNPFATTTLLRFDLPERCRVRLEVFDPQGRRVRALADSEFPAGFHSLAWDRRNQDGEHVRPGVYLYRIEAGAFRDGKKMIVLP